MSVPEQQLSVRLPADARKALELLCELEGGRELGAKARELLIRALLGEAHAAKVAIELRARTLSDVRLRDSTLTDAAEPRTRRR